MIDTGDGILLKPKAPFSEFLLRLLERRFGPVDETVRQQVQRADVETLLTWGERVLTAKSLSEVFQD